MDYSPSLASFDQSTQVGGQSTQGLPLDDPAMKPCLAAKAARCSPARQALPQDVQV
jgi:hypothetical protein